MSGNQNGASGKIAASNTNGQKGRNGRAVKRNGGPPDGSDSINELTSPGEDKVERDAFWGLVSLFIKCHEGENKDYKEGTVEPSVPLYAD